MAIPLALSICPSGILGGAADGSVFCCSPDYRLHLRADGAGGEYGPPTSLSNLILIGVDALCACNKAGRLSDAAARTLIAARRVSRLTLPVPLRCRRWSCDA
jgi:hypothetical protein